jgi:hypothetical protein
MTTAMLMQASALEKALLDLQTLSGGYYEFDTLAPAMQYTNPDLSTATRQRYGSCISKSCHLSFNAFNE